MGQRKNPVKVNEDKRLLHRDEARGLQYPWNGEPWLPTYQERQLPIFVCDAQQPFVTSGNMGQYCPEISLQYYIFFDSLQSSFRHFLKAIEYLSKPASQPATELEPVLSEGSMFVCILEEWAPKKTPACLLFMI